MRFEQAKSERALRLEAARLRESAAVEASERRARAAEEAIAKLEKDQIQWGVTDCMFVDCLWFDARALLHEILQRMHSNVQYYTYIV